MAAQGSNVSRELQEARDRFGKAFLKWREMNKLSQQDLHNFSADLKVSCHNSQFAYLERGLLEPKSSFWVGLASLNNELANGGKGSGSSKGFKYVQKEITRDRLKKATPFLNAEGYPATASDMFAMFVGEKEVNPLYVGNKEELTEEFCHEYGHTLEVAFNKIASERMLSPKKAWQELTQVEKFPQDPEYQAVCRDVLRGAHELTKEEALGIVEEYAPACGGQCPCFHALEVLADEDKDDPVDISFLRKLNGRLLEMLS